MSITETTFYGTTFEPKRDTQRLQSQSARVYTALSSGQWMSLEQIAEITGDPVQSISARIRGLRHPENGRHRIDRKHVRDGLWVYALILPRGQLEMF